MTVKNDRRLLREYIRIILKEDEGGGGDYGGGGEWAGTIGGGYDTGWGYGEYGPTLYNIFIKPFADVGTIAKASAMKVTARTKAALKIAVESALTTMIPFLTSNYSKIFELEQKELTAIKNRYKQTFADIDNAFNNDAHFISFLISPSSYITTRLASATPDAFLHTMEIFTHGSENVSAYYEDLKGRLMKIEKDLSDNIMNYRKDVAARKVGEAPRGGYMTAAKKQALQKIGVNPHESRLREDDEKKAPVKKTKEQLFGEEIAKTFADPGFKKAVESSPEAQKMQAEANKIMHQISSKVMAEAQKVLSAQTPEQIERLTGKHLGLQQKIQQMPKEEQQAATQALMKQVKAAMKNFYVMSLTKQLQGLQDVDPNNLYTRTLNSMISKIKSL